MRTRWSILAGLGMLFLAAGVIAILVDQLFVYMPTPERRSVFIQDYSPNKVIDSFASEKYVGQGMGGMGSSAGYLLGLDRGSHRYVTNERTMEPWLNIRLDECGPLMTALRDDMLLNLIHDGAEVLSDSGDAGSGYRLRYRIGKIVGSATIAPFTPKRWREHHYADGRVEYQPLAIGTQDMAGNIKISEKWFPREADAIRTSLQTL